MPFGKLDQRAESGFRGRGHRANVGRRGRGQLAIRMEEVRFPFLARAGSVGRCWLTCCEFRFSSKNRFGEVDEGVRPLR